ncbi:MAG: hypothetical protein WBC91_00210 [Phototrophicaceae bacterium]
MVLRHDHCPFKLATANDTLIGRATQSLRKSQMTVKKNSGDMNGSSESDTQS